MLLRREEGVPDPLDMLGTDAAAVVAHLEFDVFARRQEDDLALGQMDVGGPQLDARIVGRRRHRLERIEDQVLENLQDLRPLDLDRAGAGRRLHGDFRAGSGGGEPGGLLQELLRVADRERVRAALGEHESWLRQVLRRQAGLLRVGQARRVAVVLGEREAAEDRRQQVVEIVGDPAGQEAERLQAVRLDELLGGEAHLIRVAEDDDDAAQAWRRRRRRRAPSRRPARARRPAPRPTGRR